MNLQTTIILFVLLFSAAINAQTIDETFANPTNLTDKQMDEAKNFTHQGIKDRNYKEACAKDPKACKEPSDGLAVEELIGKAYGVLGIVDNKLTAKPKKDQVAEGTETTKPETSGDAKEAAETKPKGKEEKEEKTDYCVMAAMASELITSAIQTDLQQKADNQAPPGDYQLQSLLSLKQTHVARKKTAYLQSGIYGAVTACYAAMWMSGQVKPDAKFYLRLGGAVALGGLYLRKAINHEKYAERVQTVINSIPVAGNCNPWTGTSCFCKEATSKELYPSQYQEVCVLNKGNFATPKVALGCAAVVEGKTQFDKECKCKQTNSCVKSNLKAFNPKFGIGTNLMNEANQGFDLVNSGEYDQGKLDAYTTKTAAMASKMKAKIDTKSLPKLKLTEDQKKIAEALSQYMPLELASAAATAPSDYKGAITDTGVASVSSLSPAIKEKLGQAMKIGYEQGNETQATNKSQDDFTMPPIPGAEQKDENENGNEVLTFANKAIDKADVSNSPETPIFDIISNRYKRSGWKKLDRLE